MAFPRKPKPAEWTSLVRDFPNLIESDVELLGPSTSTYNCIAWALGYTDRWINPPAAQGDFVELFLGDARPRHYTKELPALDPKARCDGYKDATEMTHASRIDGEVWSSKLGSDFLISHNRSGVTGSLYGSIVVSFS